MQQTGSVSTQASYNVSNTIQETSGIQVAPRARDDSANIQSAFNMAEPCNSPDRRAHEHVNGFQDRAAILPCDYGRRDADGEPWRCYEPQRT